MSKQPSQTEKLKYLREELRKMAKVFLLTGVVFVPAFIFLFIAIFNSLRR